MAICYYMKVFLSKIIFLFEDEISWIFSKMHLHSGIVVPIFTSCLHTVLNVLSCVAFTLMVYINIYVPAYL
jgi:hypothetical protein